MNRICAFIVNRYDSPHVAVRGILVTCVVLVASALPAAAQRPFRFYDTLYRDEQAARYFYDKFAVTGEVAYRPESLPEDNESFALASDRVGFNVRLDYQLAQQFDLSVIVDASNAADAVVTVRWLALKYYRTVDEDHYAVRMAIDPVADGQGGFPQVDAAIIYSSAVNQDLMTNIAVGIRRVRVGLERLIEIANPDTTLASPLSSVEFSRALGWELHGELRYASLVDPGGSNAFFAVLGEFGSYELIREGGTAQSGDAAGPTPDARDFRGGVIWLRTGLELARPGFSVTPFVALPVGQWSPSDDAWPRSRLQIGLRLLLR